MVKRQMYLNRYYVSSRYAHGNGKRFEKRLGQWSREQLYLEKVRPVVFSLDFLQTGFILLLSNGGICLLWIWLPANQIYQQNGTVQKTNLMVY